MKKHLKWLFAEIDRWVIDGIIAPEQAGALKHRYPASEEGSAWGRIIFFSMGAILVGLGIILVFAYNWERMPKFGKLAVIMFSLLAAHATGFRLRHSAGRFKTAGEGLHLLGTMLFGAGIWLVAQVYHMEEHYPNALMIWGLGALALAWALPSVAQGIVATILLVIWNGFEAFDFENPNLFSPFMILFGILPLAWLKRSAVLTALVTVAFLVTLYFSAAQVGADLGALVVFFSACLLIAVGTIVSRRHWFLQSRPVFSFIGFLVYLALLFALSFPHHGSGFLSVNFDRPQHALLFFGFALPAVVSWGWVIHQALQDRDLFRRMLRIDYFAVPLALILILLNCLGVLGLGGWVGAAVFNLLFIFHSVMMIAYGCRSLNLKLTIVGCLLLALITLTRYADLFASLLARSLVFFLTGAALFAVGFYYSKTKKQMQEKPS